MLAELCKAELSSLEWWIWMKSSPFVFWWKHIAHNVFNWDFVISLLPLADIKAQKFHSNFWVTKFNSVSQTNWTDTYKCMMVCLKQSALSALHYTWGNEGLKPHFWTPKNPFSKLICKLTNGPQTSCIFQSYSSPWFTLPRMCSKHWCDWIALAWQGFGGWCCSGGSCQKIPEGSRQTWAGQGWGCQWCL